MLLRCIEQPSHSCRIGDVGRNRECPIRVVRLVGRFVESIGPAAGENDRIVVIQQRERHRATDAGSGSGDNRDFRGCVHDPNGNMTTVFRPS